MNLTKYFKMLTIFLTVILCLGLWNPQPASAQPQLRLKLKPEFYDIEVKNVGGTYVILTFKSRHTVIPLVAMGETLEQVKIKSDEGTIVFLHPENMTASSITSFLGGYKTNHQIIEKNLKPDTKYYFSFIGRREDDKPVLPLVGKTFTTLKRQVGFQFNTIEMIDDSDDLSDGEFKFGFFVYNMYASGSPPPLVNLQTPPLSQGAGAEHSIGSGENLNINLIENLSTDLRYFKIEATAIDDDDDGLGFWESFGILLGTGIFIPVTAGEGGIGVGVNPHAGHGDESFAEWGTAEQNIIIQNLTNMSEGESYAEQEEYQIPFIMHADPPSSDLEFKIHGQVNISYQ